MHEAEPVMLCQSRWRGRQCPIELDDHVVYMTCEAAWLSWFPGRNANRATAAQRAEAFLRTLGLWDEKPLTPEELEKQRQDNEQDLTQ